MVNNSSIQRWNRIHQKTLDNQFLQEVQRGCNCSSFEAKAILETVYEVFEPYFNNASSIKPGQIQLPLVSVDTPGNQALNEAKLVNVTLTLFDEKSDMDIRKKEGVAGLRQYQIQRMATEAFQQGGLLTVEDFAFRLFNCGARTICRDIKCLKERGISLPLRSTIKDMGRTLSHRNLIVKRWLAGDEYQSIARKTFHSVQAVSNYVDKFKRVAVLTHQNQDIPTISFLVRISSTLVEEYQKILQNTDSVQHRKDEIFGVNNKPFSKKN